MQRIVLLFVLVVAIAACSQVIAPPPPSGRPTVQVEALVSGAPITVAAHAARVLQDFNFTTKRFSSDSTWGYRAEGPTSARLRYTRPMDDSTRVLLEFWGKCSTDRLCTRADALGFIRQLSAEEGPPADR